MRRYDLQKHIARKWLRIARENRGTPNHAGALKRAHDELHKAKLLSIYRR